MHNRQSASGNRKSEIGNRQSANGNLQLGFAFVFPKPDEVAAYAESIGYRLDGQLFCDHYQARGWRYSGNVKMKDWRAAVRTWKARAPQQEKFDADRAKAAERERRRQQDERYMKEYLDEIAALRSWRGTDCGWDPVERELRLIQKIENNFGRKFVRELIRRLENESHS